MMAAFVRVEFANEPKFIPNTIANAGVRAVASNPELRLVTYCSLLIKGAMVGSIVCNQARSYPCPKYLEKSSLLRQTV